MFDGQLRFSDQVSLRDLRPGEVYVDVEIAGICETDLQLCRGYMGFRGVLGHEFVGVARTGRYAGRRVAGEINCSCGKCSVCLAGLRNHCPHRTVIGILNHDGAFADTVIVPEENLHVIPDSLESTRAVFVEPVAAACRISEQMTVAGRRIVVLGDGRLGNLCAQVLRHQGASVSVVGKHEFKLQLLRELGFTTHTLHEVPADRSADIVVDCTGSPTGLETAVRLVRSCGTIVLKTTVADHQQMHMAPLVIEEISVVGSRCGPFQPALEMLASGAVRTDLLLSARYPLSAASEAFERAIRKDTLKVLLDVRP